ncbi:bacterial flagellin helical region family protein [Heliorestis convoluta]|uniref:Flagellin n=1 Tax=Heliorestis convoluta TaxID=356322 RepID=A0A5Q2N4L9_9FIRM|nr:bacterial flagellin helical region family protein [Heliorestis convoluta]
MRINHNIQALNAYRQLTQNQTTISKHLEKLSSGLRINRAADDAAGLAISEKMRSQIRGLAAAEKGTLDSISLIQTAEGALDSIHSMLQRMRELAVQAANDTYTEDDKAAIQEEINQLTSEINRIAETTEFNKRNLLNGGVAITGGKGIADPDAIAYGTGMSNLTIDSNSKLDAGNYRIDVTSEVTNLVSNGQSIQGNIGNPSVTQQATVLGEGSYKVEIAYGAVKTLDGAPVDGNNLLGGTSPIAIQSTSTLKDQEHNIDVTKQTVVSATEVNRAGISNVDGSQAAAGTYSIQTSVVLNSGAITSAGGAEQIIDATSGAISNLSIAQDSAYLHTEDYTIDVVQLGSAGALMTAAEELSSPAEENAKVTATSALSGPSVNLQNLTLKINGTTFTLGDGRAVHALGTVDLTDYNDRIDLRDALQSDLDYTFGSNKFKVGLDNDWKLTIEGIADNDVVIGAAAGNTALGFAGTEFSTYTSPTTDLKSLVDFKLNDKVITLTNVKALGEVNLSEAAGRAAVKAALQADINAVFTGEADTHDGATFTVGLDGGRLTIQNNDRALGKEVIIENTTGNDISLLGFTTNNLGDANKAETTYSTLNNVELRFDLRKNVEKIESSSATFTNNAGSTAIKLGDISFNVNNKAVYLSDSIPTNDTSKSTYHGNTITFGTNSIQYQVEVKQNGADAQVVTVNQNHNDLQTVTFADASKFSFHIKGDSFLGDEPLHSVVTSVDNYSVKLYESGTGTINHTTTELAVAGIKEGVDTYTITNDFSAGQTITIAGKTFTAVNGTADAAKGQFSVDGNIQDTRTSLLLALNHTNGFDGKFTAAVGTEDNVFTLTEVGTNGKNAGGATIAGGTAVGDAYTFTGTAAVNDLKHIALGTGGTGLFVTLDRDNVFALENGAVSSIKFEVNTAEEYSAQVLTAGGGVVQNSGRFTLDSNNASDAKSIELGNGVEFNYVYADLAEAGNLFFSVGKGEEVFNMKLFSTDDVEKQIGAETFNKGDKVSFANHGLSIDTHFVDTTSGQSTTFEVEDTTVNKSLSMQIGANQGQSFSVDINKMTSKALKISSDASSGDPGVPGAAFTEIAGVTAGIAGKENTKTEYALDVSDHTKAAAAITVIDNAIRDVSLERSKLGAFQNRLEYTVTNLKTFNENLTASESRIRDADMALEMTNFSKNNIINQAATAMLAQANQLPQGVLQLLQ